MTFERKAAISAALPLLSSFIVVISMLDARFVVDEFLRCVI